MDTVDIPAIVFSTLDMHNNITNPTIDDIEYIDTESRNNARLAIKKTELDMLGG